MKQIEHDITSIAAYHDGELSGLHQKQVETHLASCIVCQKELENLRKLSSLLRALPAASAQIQTEIFVTRVSLRLPRVTGGLQVLQPLRNGLQWAPAGLFGFWAFLQATFIVSGIISFLFPYIPIAGQVNGWMSMQNMVSANEIFNLLIGDLLDLNIVDQAFWGVGGFLSWNMILNIGLTGLISVLFLSWFASWWIQNKHQNRSNPSKGSIQAERS